MLLLAATALAGPDPGLPPRTHPVGRTVSSDVIARDGVALRTHRVVPKGDGPFPTIVTRYPYLIGPVLEQECRTIARRGYACVWQATRGRLGSGGEWTPFLNEERDGQDTVAWVRAQPWSDGQVAWIGDSYLAGTGWTVVPEDPDGVTTLVSRVFGPALYDSAFDDGLLRHELVTAWMTLMPDRRNRLVGLAHHYHRALAHRPRVTMDEVAAGHEVPWFRDWIAAEEASDPRWTEGDPGRFERAAEHTSVPVFFVGGWSDPFVEAELDAWARLGSRSESLLVIGPWSHLGRVPSAMPLRGIRGPGSGGGRAAQRPRVLDWYGHHLLGRPAAYPTRGVATYVVGGDRWEVRDAWPPPTSERTFGAVAGTGRCDGTLVEGGRLAAPVAYTYDPEAPLRSRGGAGLLAGAIPTLGGVKPGFVHAPDHCTRREDVLRFVSAPLTAPLHLAGTLRVELDVSSDAADTAFGFRLLERRPGGEEVLLREGFSTLALRDGPPRRPYTAGERVTVVPDAQPLEAELPAGARLVLVVTSASFPAFEAHPNVAGVLALATETRVAHQQVHRATLVVPEVTP